MLLESAEKPQMQRHTKRLEMFEKLEKKRCFVKHIGFEFSLLTTHRQLSESFTQKKSA